MYSKYSSDLTLSIMDVINLFSRVQVVRPESISNTEIKYPLHIATTLSLAYEKKKILGCFLLALDVGPASLSGLLVAAVSSQGSTLVIKLEWLGPEPLVDLMKITGRVLIDGSSGAQLTTCERKPSCLYTCCARSVIEQNRLFPSQTMLLSVFNATAPKVHHFELELTLDISSPTVLQGIHDFREQRPSVGALSTPLPTRVPREMASVKTCSHADGQNSKLYIYDMGRSNNELVCLEGIENMPV